MNISVLNKKIDKAIQKNGIDTVIAWLSVIENIDISENDIISFKKIKKITLKSLNIRLLKTNNEKSTDAKIIITNLCSIYTNLKIKALAELLNISENSIFYYKNQFSTRLQYQQNYTDFFKAYNQTKNIIENER